jgi:hypothetical protein
MGNLQTALGLLRENVGDFDNIKLLLGAGEDVTRDSVTCELLTIAQGVADGSIKPITSFRESKLSSIKMDL